MACGSVVAKSEAASLSLTPLIHNNLQQQPPFASQKQTNADKQKQSINREIDHTKQHEAILFLQKEHEQVLTGLHNQVQSLQQRCDDLQFQAHLKPLISREEESLRDRLQEATSSLDSKDETIANYQKQLLSSKEDLEEHKEQFKWKQINIQQQLDVSTQRTDELKTEVTRLRGQVSDLKAFNSALRSCTQQSPTPPKTSKSALVQRTRESIESLESRSLTSRDDLTRRMSFRLGSSQFRTPATPQTPSLPPLKIASSPRVSSASVTLPPISGTSHHLTGTEGRRHVRRQLRLLSAPILDFPNKESRLPP